MPKRKERSRKPHHSSYISDKANLVLQIILFGMVAIVLKIWYLTMIQHDEKVDIARRPRQKSVVNTTTRATIRDRFNIPLAVNKIKYQAAVNYSHLRDIPSIVWEKNEKGVRHKRFKRREYIKDLSFLLSKELSMDSDRIEDLIHSKAALYFHIPFIIKEELTEQEFYRLKYLEKDYPGLVALKVPKREYPLGEVGADILGYMGPIQKDEYETIIQELKDLKKYLRARDENEDPELPLGFASPSEVRKRVKEIQQRAYTINDYIGKAGVEAAFEEQLRGYQGETRYYTDAQGNYLRELPGGRNPQSGQRLLLSISSELQEFAEKILIQNESIRTQEIPNWIKGGAIVVMDPNEGDILAMASYPRYNPNDFIPSGDFESDTKKKGRISRWFETETCIANLWDQKCPLERELYNTLEKSIETDTFSFSWDSYLDFILPNESPIRLRLEKISTIQEAVDLLNTAESIISLTRSSNPSMLFRVLYDSERTAFSAREEEEIANSIKNHQQEVEPLKNLLDQAFGELNNNYDRLLFLDLLRLTIDPHRFSEELLHKVGRKKLDSFRRAAVASIIIKEAVEEMTRRLFHEIHFLPWKEAYGKELIRKKREEEKANGRYTKPYIDYFDKEEKLMFHQFWNNTQAVLTTCLIMGQSSDQSPELTPYIEYFLSWHRELSQGAHKALEWRKAYESLQKMLKNLDLPTAQSYLSTMRSFKELQNPLWGRYLNLRNEHGVQLEKHLAAAFYPVYGFGFCRSYAFRQAAVQGSIFKIVTGYTALMQRYQQLNKQKISLKELNPLTIIDREFHKGGVQYVGETIEGRAIPRLYQGGRLLTSLTHNIGVVDLVKAIETSSNPYFSLLAGDILDSPWDLASAAEIFSYGAKTGIQIPGEISGFIPNDLDVNKTGLYSFAIGQHSFVVTPLQTAVVLSTVANGGNVLKPKVISMKAGRERDEEKLPTEPFDHFPLEESLSLIGIDFPLYTAAIDPSIFHSVTPIQKEVVRKVPMPKEVREILLKGMEGVATKITKDFLWSLAIRYRDYPEAIQSLKNVQGTFVGKSSSAESMESIYLDREKGIQKCTHIWFGGIAFEDDDLERNKPELVVVVYLRFGSHGKDAAPIAAQIVEKWREIKQKHVYRNTLKNWELDKEAP